VLAGIVQVCVPLFDMIRHWVFDGQLEDPACEFFIVPNTQALGSGGSSGGVQQQLHGGTAEQDLWRDAYRLEPAKLPPFITKVRRPMSWAPMFQDLDGTLEHRQFHPAAFAKGGCVCIVETNIKGCLAVRYGWLSSSQWGGVFADVVLLLHYGFDSRDKSYASRRSNPRRCFAGKLIVHVW
jgi:hypothetical protein